MVFHGSNLDENGPHHSNVDSTEHAFNLDHANASSTLLQTSASEQSSIHSNCIEDSASNVSEAETNLIIPNSTKLTCTLNSDTNTACMNENVNSQSDHTTNDDQIEDKNQVDHINTVALNDLSTNNCSMSCGDVVPTKTTSDKLVATNSNSSTRYNDEDISCSVSELQTSEMTTTMRPPGSLNVSAGRKDSSTCISNTPTDEIVSTSEPDSGNCSHNSSSLSTVESSRMITNHIECNTSADVVQTTFSESPSNIQSNRYDALNSVVASTMTTTVQNQSGVTDPKDAVVTSTVQNQSDITDAKDSAVTTTVQDQSGVTDPKDSVVTLTVQKQSDITDAKDSVVTLTVQKQSDTGRSKDSVVVPTVTTSVQNQSDIEHSKDSASATTTDLNGNQTVSSSMHHSEADSREDCSNNDATKTDLTNLAENSSSSRVASQSVACHINSTTIDVAAKVSSSFTSTDTQSIVSQSISTILPAPISIPGTSTTDTFRQRAVPLTDTAAQSRTGSTARNSIQRSARGSSTPSASGSSSRHQILPNDFLYGTLLGEGAYARVLHCLHIKSRRDYAIKIMEKRLIRKENKVSFVQMERTVMCRATHPNVVRLIYTFQDKEYLFMVMDLCRGGDLLGVIRYFRTIALAQHRSHEACPVDVARFYMAEIVSALEYLHTDLRVVHRDLKPENILLTEDGHIKIADFGSAKDEQIQTASQNQFCGTAEYVSPEMLRDEEVHCAADLWALGCILYQFLTGNPLFQGDSEYLTLKKITDYAEGTTPLNIPENWPESAKDLLRALLDPIPHQRIGAGSDPLIQQHHTCTSCTPKEVCSHLRTYRDLKSHPFFESVNFDILSQSQIEASKLRRRLERARSESRRHVEHSNNQYTISPSASVATPTLSTRVAQTNAVFGSDLRSLKDSSNLRTIHESSTHSSTTTTRSNTVYRAPGTLGDLYSKEEIAELWKAPYIPSCLDLPEPADVSHLNWDSMDGLEFHPTETVSNQNDDVQTRPRFSTSVATKHTADLSQTVREDYVPRPPITNSPQISPAELPPHLQPLSLDVRREDQTQNTDVPSRHTSPLRINQTESQGANNRIETSVNATTSSISNTATSDVTNTTTSLRKPSVSTSDVEELRAGSVTQDTLHAAPFFNLATLLGRYSRVYPPATSVLSMLQSSFNKTSIDTMTTHLGNAKPNESETSYEIQSDTVRYAPLPYACHHKDTYAKLYWADLLHDHIQKHREENMIPNPTKNKSNQRSRTQSQPICKEEQSHASNTSETARTHDGSHKEDEFQISCTMHSGPIDLDQMCESNNRVVVHVTENSLGKVKEDVIMWTRLYKRRGALGRSLVRDMVLTNKPRLVYFDPQNKTLKGTIPWSTNLKAQVVDQYKWILHVPGESLSYRLVDKSGAGPIWVCALQELCMMQRYDPLREAALASLLTFKCAKEQVMDVKNLQQIQDSE